MKIFCAVFMLMGMFFLSYLTYPLSSSHLSVVLGGLAASILPIGPKSYRLLLHALHLLSSIQVDVFAVSHISMHRVLWAEFE
jgi:hypothetical protein